jgi:hypothetical protein
MVATELQFRFLLAPPDLADARVSRRDAVTPATTLLLSTLAADDDTRLRRLPRLTTMSG